MTPYERVMIIFLADAALNADSAQEVYELLAEIANTDDIILEPYHEAKKRKKKIINYKVGKKKTKDPQWHDFDEEMVFIK